MNVIRHISLIIGLIVLLQGCVSSSGGDSSDGLQNDGSNRGYLTISESHPTLSTDDLLSFRAAQAWTVRHELTIGGQQLNEEYLDATRSYFIYSGFPRNTVREFELRFIGEFGNQRVELLRAKGQHTFKTYAANTCKPSRADDCSNVELSDDNSTSIEQLLEISEITHLDCDGDGVNNLKEIYFNSDPCDGVSDQPEGEVAAAVAKTPSNNAVLEKSSSYVFDFSSTIDTLHTDYMVQVYNSDSGTTLAGSSSSTPVLANQAADYSVRVTANLIAGNTYNWRVFGISADQTMRPLSPRRLFTVANAVPVLTQTLPNNNSVESFVDADTGHLFRFNSTTDAGVHEYRIHLTDETNHIDYGYKRVSDVNNNSGGSYSTTRNLALKQGGRHRWSVTANNESGDILAQTPTREFTIETIQSIEYNLGLSSPSSNASLIKVDQSVGYNFSFTSSTNTGVSEYRVHLRDTSNSIDYGYKQIFVNGSNTTLSTTRNLNLKVNGSHLWYITANNADGAQLAQSAERRFTIESQPVTTVLDISDARNTAARDYQLADVGHNFYFESSNDTGIAEYWVYIEEIDGPNYFYKAAPSAGTTSSSSYQVTRNLALNSGKTHRFYVTANDLDGNELLRSTISTFVIGSGTIPTINATPMGEVVWASSSIGYTFSFTVTDADDVKNYRVHVADTDTPKSFNYKEIDAAANTVNGAVSTTLNINTNSLAQHEWYVTAHDASGIELAQSATRTFTPSVPALSSLSPSDGETISLSSTGYDFNFSSSNNTGVAEYRVFVFDIDNNNGSFDYKAEQPNTVDGPSDYTVRRNITLQPSTLHRWRVAALDAAGIEIGTTEWQPFATSP